MKIVTAAEMKLLDRRASAEFSIPSLLLMENAARGLVDAMERTIGPSASKRISILAGRGNNGGDGIAAARHLRARGADVTVYLLSPLAKMAGDPKLFLDIWISTEGALQVVGAFKWPRLVEALAQSDLIVDALLGTGLSHPVEGDYAKAIKAINGSGRTVVSVDIPSGVSADSGEALGSAVRADYTFTMAAPKRGHFLREGLELKGRLETVDIGFPPALWNQPKIAVELTVPAKLRGRLAPRSRAAHKGSFGHLLVIAGSAGKMGAAQMTGLAALRCGVGLLTNALPESTDTGVMEAMTLPLPRTQEGTLSLAAEPRLLQALEGKEAVALGPGLSQNLETQKLVRNLVGAISVPIVIDADGLNALAEDLSVLKRRKGATVITPHPGEMGRLIGKPADAVERDRIGTAADFAERWNVIVVLKGAHTLIASPDRSIFVNATGNPGMATAGTGDALTGIISAWLAQGIPAAEAARLGVYLHGLAGDLAAKEKGEISMITSDLIAKIPDAIQTLIQGRA